MSRGKSGPDQITRAALDLFGTHGIHATSLQMIADELGVTKAAVYYHFPTKQQIVEEALKPAMAGLASLVERAREIPSGRGRVVQLVRGLADEAITHRDLYSVILRDVAALSVVAEAAGVFGELNQMLAGPGDDPVRQVEVAMFLSGLVAPAVDERVQQLSDEEVRRGIIAVGMHLAR